MIDFISELQSIKDVLLVECLIVIFLHLILYLMAKILDKNPFDS